MPKSKTKKKLKKIKKTASKKNLKAKKTGPVKKSVKTKKTAKTKAKKTIKKKPVKAKKSKAKKTGPVKKSVKTKKTVKTKAKKTIKKKPVKADKAKSLFNAKEMHAITKQLKELRDSLSNVVKTKKELDLVEHDTGDVIDIASQSLDKEMLFELSGNELSMLEDVDAALRRIDNGVYGLCEYCRKPIRKLRIKAIPQARYCMACQSGNERTSRT